MDHTTGVPSTAAIAGHPIHPMLVVFPIAFLMAAFATDVLARRSPGNFWPRVSFWLTAAGLIMGLLAAIPGAIDFFTIPRAREHLDGWIHFLGNVTVLLLAAVSLLFRRRAPEDRVPTPAFALSAVVAALLLVTGWYGGELSYRHMIGVTGHSGGHSSGGAHGSDDAHRSAGGNGGESGHGGPGHSH